MKILSLIVGLFFICCALEGGMNKKVLLIIARDGFRAEEYFDTREALEKNGVKVVTASDVPGQAYAHNGQTASVDLIVDDVKPTDYDGIFLIGGPGAMEWLNTTKVYDLMRKAAASGNLWGAICISPRILYNADLLEGRKITGWDGDKLLKTKCPDADVVGGGVVVDGSLITAEGPSVAKEFGNTIAQTLKE